MCGIGHGGVEAILIGGLSGISNLVSMLMINSGAMQNTLDSGFYSGSCIWDSFYRGLLCRGSSSASSHLCD